jgi:hypothetical protein
VKLSVPSNPGVGVKVKLWSGLSASVPAAGCV